MCPEKKKKKLTVNKITIACLTEEQLSRLKGRLNEETDNYCIVSYNPTCKVPPCPPPMIEPTGNDCPETVEYTLPCICD